MGESTHIKVEPEDEYNMKANVNDAKCNEDVPLESHQKRIAIMDEDRHNSMPYAHHAQDD